MRIAFKQMSNEVWLIVNLPINTIFVDVLNPLLLRHQESRDTTRSLAKHSKKEQVPRTALALAANGELVGVPCLCPVLCVPMDRSEEEMMKEPYMARASGIKAMIRLEVEEKYLPFLPKAMCHIVPEAFDAGVVDASPPDEGSAAATIDFFQVYRDFNIFNTVIAAHLTRTATGSNDVKEQLKHTCPTVVVVHSDTENKPRIAVDDAMYNHLVAYKAVLAIQMC
ncbi:hypothetical protein B0H14DRAFT_2721775 [Mycena olivaceomarginata]|nr:hypothetical protein B0H14DRAFT_2721775 [Mycena olivaceomarginata]